MKRRGSSLNPYAESYIPLSKREVDDRNCVTEDFSKISIGPGTSEHYIHNQPHSSPYLNEKAPVTVSSPLKNQPFHGSLPQHDSEVPDMGMFDKEDMDLEYLRVNFPGISTLSLADVYEANKGDLDAAIDMLSHLESCTADLESLPDSLDIGDTSESGFEADQPSSKLKNVAGDASTSSSSKKKW